MKIIQSGNKHMIYGDELVILDRLPACTYKIGFSEMNGFFLVKSTDLSVMEQKIYGENEEKVKKALAGFKKSDRNFGVMFTGKKGYGKSLSLQLLSKSAIEEFDLPVIIVNLNIPGLCDFIQTIEQEAVFIFDEYEKNFSVDGGGENQERMLSLFDGLSVSKHMYVISANDLSRMSEYMFDRPGRFHYNFKFEEPSPEEVKEYMEDKLLPDYQHLATLVSKISRRVTLNFDILRAIAFELNMGYSLDSAIRDLNISLNESSMYEIKLKLEDGTEATRDVKIRISTKEANISYRPHTCKVAVFVATIDLFKTDYRDDRFVVDPKKVKIHFSHTADDSEYHDDFVLPTSPKIESIIIAKKNVMNDKEVMTSYLDLM